MRTFHGVWPALVTPFADDNTVNVTVLKSLVDYLISKNVDGFYVGGTTGEGVFMSVAERKQVMDTILTQINGRVPVIVHVGSLALPDAIDLAQHAAQQGVVGVSSIIPPLFNTLESAYRYFKTLAESLPELQVYPYFLSQTIKPVELMQRLIEIPNIAGTKYTGPDIYEFKRLIELGGADWTFFSGMDEMCVFAAMAGSSGNIGSTLNFMPGVYKQIHQNIEAGDFTKAYDLQVKANHVTSIMADIGFQGALKTVLGLIGFDCGAPRLPYLPLTEAQKQDLRSALDDTDFSALVAL